MVVVKDGEMVVVKAKDVVGLNSCYVLFFFV